MENDTIKRLLKRCGIKPPDNIQVSRPVVSRSVGLGIRLVGRSVLGSVCRSWDRSVGRSWDQSVLCRSVGWVLGSVSWSCGRRLGVGGLGLQWLLAAAGVAAGVRHPLGRHSRTGEYIGGVGKVEKAGNPIWARRCGDRFSLDRDFRSLGSGNSFRMVLFQNWGREFV